MEREVEDLSKLSFVLRSVWLHSVLRQRGTAEAGRNFLTNIFIVFFPLFFLKDWTWLQSYIRLIFVIAVFLTH